MLIQGLFYLFAAILVLAALGVISARNPVYSALALVMCFVTSAAIWLLVEAEFSPWCWCWCMSARSWVGSPGTELEFAL